MPELPGLEFIRALPRGVTGPVFVGRDLAQGRKVAIKQVVGWWNGDQEEVARVAREAHLVERADHPGLVRLHEVRTSGDDLFLVTEYVDGPTLRWISQRTRPSPGQVVLLVKEVAAALDHAWGLGFVHGSVRPANIFVTGSAGCKVGDLGFGRILGDRAHFTTLAGQLPGAVAYMSPEQAAGRSKLDRRSDVYALAVVAYELLLGRPPFASDTGNPLQTLEGHISGKVPRPTAIAPGFPRAVEDVLLRALDKNIKRRYGSVGEFALRLERAAATGGAAWVPPADMSGLLAAALEGSPRPAPAPPAGHPAAELPPDGRIATPVAPAPEDPAAVGLPSDREPQPDLGATIFRGAAPTQDIPADAASTVVLAPRVVPAPAVEAQPGETVVLPPAAAPAPDVPQAPEGGQGSEVGAGAPIDDSSFAAPAIPAASEGASRARSVALFLAAAAAVVVGATLLYFLLPQVLESRLVKGATVDVSPPGTAHCPAVSWTFTAHLQVAGRGGNISYRWLKPNGELTDVEQTSAASGVVRPISMQFSVNSNSRFSGTAQLHVLKPTDLYSKPTGVTMDCP